jgi:protein-tyrosine kinase
MSKIFEMLRQAQRDQALLKQTSPSVQANSQNFEVLHLSGKDEELFHVSGSVVTQDSEVVPPSPTGVFRGETFKLVQHLYLAQDCPSPRVLVFCAVEQGHERGWICPRVAEILASHVKRSVCVVDANVASPSLHTYFKTENRGGFRAAMVEPDPVKRFARSVGRDGLWLIPGGEAANGNGSHAALSYDRLGPRVAELRASFDHVLVDAPPALGESIAAYLGSLADGVILVVEQGFTPREAVRDLKEEVEAVGGRVLGVVLHRRPLPFADRLESQL